MTKIKIYFSTFTLTKENFIFNGDNNKGRIVGFSIVDKYLNPTIVRIFN